MGNEQLGPRSRDSPVGKPPSDSRALTPRVLTVASVTPLDQPEFRGRLLGTMVDTAKHLEKAG